MGGTYFSSLLEWLLVNSYQDDGMGSKTISGRSLHISDNVLAGHEINERTCAKLLGHLSLLITTINRNDLQTHSLSVLASQRAESTTSTNDGDGLARSGSRLLESLVDGDTGAENGRDGLKIAFLRNTSDMSSFGDAVFLEGTVDSVAGEEGFGAKRLI